MCLTFGMRMHCLKIVPMTHIISPIDVLSFNSGSDPVLNQTISRLKKDGIPSTVISAKEVQLCVQLCNCRIRLTYFSKVALRAR